MPHISFLNSQIVRSCTFLLSSAKAASSSTTFLCGNYSLPLSFKEPILISPTLAGVSISLCEDKAVSVV